MDLEKLHCLFYPKSIVIIGASSNPLKPGGQPLSALVAAGYSGEIFPINPRYEEINGLKCYPNLKSVGKEIDLAIIAVPAKYVPGMLQECGEAKVQTAVIFTSGFAETGEEGKKLQEEIVSVANKYNIRFAGPNCLGIVNAPAKVMANFAVSHNPEKVVKDNAYAFISQSGGFGTITYAEAQKQGLGAQILVSTGNEADLDFTTFLHYIVEHTDVKAVAAYLEGVKDGKSFVQAADKALTKGIPLILLKVGKHEIAAQAAKSHTGSMVGNDDIYQGFFHQKGIIRVNSVEEMLPLLSLFADKKLPRGNRIGILSSSGGGSVYLADLCTDAGLEVVKLSPNTCKQLEENLPSFITANNPVDLTSHAMMEEGILKNALKAVLEDPQVDLVMVYFNVAGEPTRHIIAQLEEAYRTADKPILCIGWSHNEEDHLLAQELMRQAGIPNTLQVEHGVKALATLASFAGHFRMRQASQESPGTTNGLVGKGKEYLAGFDRKALTEREAKQLLQLYNIPVVREEVARSAQEAVSLAEKIGYPVVLKILSPDILHKTEAGGVILNLHSAEEVTAAYDRIINNAKAFNPEAHLEGVLVAELIPPGRELILGIKADPTFGNCVLVGTGGVFVEVLRDFASGVPPISRLEAEAIIKRLKGYPMLEAFRNLGPADLESLVEAVLNLSRMALDLEGIISELEINPLIVGEKGQGVKAVDALITLN
ncbi:MAG: acetate--CoA ligase family protein [Clostridia bacterium]|nr:acetate--CoA ligase family protein [Clostridia bacterium]